MVASLLVYILSVSWDLVRDTSSCQDDLSVLVRQCVGRSPDDAAEALLDVMFARPPVSGGTSGIKNERRKAKALALVKDLSRRHSAIRYDRLLQICVDRSVSFLMCETDS